MMLQAPSGASVTQASKEDHRAEQLIKDYKLKDYKRKRPRLRSEHRAFVRRVLGLSTTEFYSTPISPIPIVFSLPSLIFSIPPLMVLIPTTFPFGIQITSPVVSFAAVITLVVDCFVQSCFRFFDCMPAFVFVIRMNDRCCRK